MCGIGGFYNTNGGKTPVSSITSLWCALEDRGTHAHGMAFNWVNGDKPVVYKKVGAANKSKSVVKKYLSGKNLRYVLLHTRFTTQGSTHNMFNNHPIVRDGITLTHNGVLRNDRQVFNQLNVKPLGEVDTEAINAALRHKGVKWTSEKIQGSMSIAWIDEKDSTQNVHLLTNGGNPLVIARTFCGNIVWASCLYHIEEAGFKILSHFNALPFKQYTLQPDGAIRSTWISKNRKMPNVNTWHSSHSNYYGNYDEESLDWDDMDWEDLYYANKGATSPSSSSSGGIVTQKKKGSKREPTNRQKAASNEWAYSKSRGWFKINDVDWY
tara:strand:- start:42 stop:1013 length:972 start_codon:yes stop_codon:yes gene_type:complete